MASSLLSRCLCFIFLYLLTLCSCLKFASPFIVVRPPFAQQRQITHQTLPQIPPRTCRLSVKNKQEPSKDLKKQHKTPAKPKKKTTTVKAKGTKQTKNGVKTKTKATASTAKKKTRQKDEGPFYWRNETDKVTLLDQNFQNTTNGTRVVQFRVRGNPRPLRRHRTARGFMYNPSSKYQASFRQVVQDMFWPSSSNDDEQQHAPLFDDEEHQLAMRLVFYMKRPKLHFVGGKPGPGRLRPVSPKRLAPTRTDVDNLCKFVLDSLNGLVYVDDRQVASIHATKVYDNDGQCQGCIHVSIQRLTDEDVDDLLSSSDSMLPLPPNSS